MEPQELVLGIIIMRKNSLMIIEELLETSESKINKNSLEHFYNIVKPKNSEKNRKK